MSKKLIVIISVVLLVIVVGLVGFYLLNQNSSGTQNPVVAGFKNFFPFGGNSNPTPITPSPTTTPTPTPTPAVNNFTAKLRELSKEPVSGAGTLDVKAGTIVRYIEKATGHIFEVELFSPNQNRISNTTLPIVYDGLWGNKNNSLIARYLKDDNQTVDTYSLTVKDTATSTENAITGIAFPANISDVAVFGTSVFYLVQSGDTSLGFVSKFDGTSKKQIWASPIKEVLPQYVNDKTVALTTKPAQNVFGYIYLVNTGTGVVSSPLGGVMGLSTLVSPDATQILYLEQADNDAMFVTDAKTKLSTNITPATFPEKCVWSKKDKTIVYCAVPRDTLDGSSLTSWYKGQITLNDDIWKFDIKNNVSTVVENFSAQSFDVIKPILSDSEQYLIFINKRDNSLWSLDLTK